MNISEILKLAKERLNNVQGDYLGIEVILAHVLEKNREFLIAHPDFEIIQPVEERFWALFERFYDGEPVAYLTNKKEFYGLDFYVDKRVLIPRPETELLVDKVLEFAKQIESGKQKKISSKIKILDIGTGSGCIAISIAKNLPGAKVLATEISLEALEVARQNAKNHQVEDRVEFLQSDLLGAIVKQGRGFDIIVANLPYIGEKKFNFVSKEALKYEPNLALFGGENGLFLYEKLFKQLTDQSLQPKFLLGEFGFLQGEEMRALLNKFFIQERWAILEDLALIERVFVVEFFSKFQQENE